MGNVVDFTGITKYDIPPDRVLEQAKDRLGGVVLIGYNKEGGLYFASSYGDIETVNWLLDQGKQHLFSGPDDDGKIAS